jgi:RHS repeat-associated protein
MAWMTQFCHFDALGSVVAHTNSNGEIQDIYSYDAFGGIRHGVSNRAFLFIGSAGYYSEDTGDCYIRARTYQSRYGRFLSRDVDVSLQPYAYVSNGPLRYIDPSGAVEVAINPGGGPSSEKEVAGMDWKDWPQLPNTGHTKFCVRVTGDCQCCIGYDYSTFIPTPIWKYGLRNIKVEFKLEVWINSIVAGRKFPGGVDGVYSHELLHVKNMIKAINDDRFQQAYLRALRTTEQECLFDSVVACEKAFKAQRHNQAKEIFDILYWRGFNHAFKGHPTKGKPVLPIPKAPPAKETIKKGTTPEKVLGIDPAEWVCGPGFSIPDHDERPRGLYNERWMPRDDKGQLIKPDWEPPADMKR